MPSRRRPKRCFSAPGSIQGEGQRRSPSTTSRGSPRLCYDFLPEVVEPARFSPFGAIRESLTPPEDQALPAAWRGRCHVTHPPETRLCSETNMRVVLALGSE